MYIGSLPTASNRATYFEALQLVDDETDEGLDLTGRTILIEVRKPGCWTVELSATNGSGVSITDNDDGRFTLTFAASQMRGLCQMQYEVGITLTCDDGDGETENEVTQFFIGTLPVLDGIVS